MPERRVMRAYKLPPDLIDDVEMECRMRRMTITSAVELGLRWFLSQTKLPPSQRDPMLDATRPKDEECEHPKERRLGNFCAACGRDDVRAK